VVTINGVAFTVIGVAPPQPVALTPMPVNLYIPTMMLRVGYRWCSDSLAAGCTTLTLIGRLAKGRTVSEAAAEFPTIMPAGVGRTRLQGENNGVAVRQPRGMSEDDQGTAPDRDARRRGDRPPHRLLRKPGRPAERSISRTRE
jgi:hypothetical protein